jgi:hypothetical protein
VDCHLELATPALTFSTSGAINHAIAEPPYVERRHPVQRMFHQPEAGRIFAGEDPSTMPHHDWSPLTNLSYAKHQLGVIYTNYHCVLTCLRDFDVHGIGLFALAGGVLIPGGLRQRLQDEPWRRAVVPVVYLVGWYLPVASGDTAHSPC